jgi:DNA/RNA-binding domain of Phe-tRNA-synthetase-like protein
MLLNISADLRACFPGLRVLVVSIANVKVEKESVELRRFGEGIVEQVKEGYDLKSLKDVPIFRAYRDFFWSVGIDPTKNRPAAEALIRRILRGKPLPKINTLVDAYNLASIKTCVALAAFDSDKLRGNLVMRFAREGEKFLGIGMEKPAELRGSEVVIADEEKLIAIYPHRDSDQTKVTKDTENVLLLVCGVPGIEAGVLSNARQVAIDYITKFCGGKAAEII